MNLIPQHSTVCAKTRVGPMGSRHDQQAHQRQQTLTVDVAWVSVHLCDAIFLQNPKMEEGQGCTERYWLSETDEEKAVSFMACCTHP